MRKRLAETCLFIIAFSLTVPTFSQSTAGFVKIEAEALRQVPSEKRVRLAEQLEDYLHRSRIGDLAGIYDLRPATCRYGLTKEGWLKQAHVASVGRLVRFTVKEVYAGDYTAPANLEGEKWIARGCGTYRQGRVAMTYEGSLHLVLVSGDWYICSSGVAIEGPANHPIRCLRGL